MKPLIMRLMKYCSLALALLMGPGLLCGCTQNPLSSDMPRTPYGRYQALRGGEPPQQVPDTFGNMRPALRARLQPMDRP